MEFTGRDDTRRAAVALGARLPPAGSTVGGKALRGSRLDVVTLGSLAGRQGAAAKDDLSEGLETP